MPRRREEEKMIKLKTIAKIVAVAATVAQTTTDSADYTALTGAMVGLLNSLLPIIIVFAIISVFIGLFKKLPEMFRVFDVAKIRAVKWISLAPLVLLVAQTTTGSVDYSALTGAMVGLFSALMPIIIVFAIISVFIGLFKKLPDFIRASKAVKAAKLAGLAALAAQTAAPTDAVNQAINTVNAVSPILWTLLMAVVLIALLVLPVKAVIENILSKV